MTFRIWRLSATLQSIPRLKTLPPTETCAIQARLRKMKIRPGTVKKRMGTLLPRISSTNQNMLERSMIPPSMLVPRSLLGIAETNSIEMSEKPPKPQVPSIAMATQSQ